MTTVHNALIALIALGLAAGGCAKESQAEAKNAAARPVQVRTEPVQRRSFTSTIQLTSTLEPAAQVTLYAQVAERILHFPLDNGDPVRKGQVVARVRSETLKQALQQIGAEIESLDVQISSNKRELERARALARGNVITRQSLDQAEAAYLAGVARRKSLSASRSQVAINAGNAAITAPLSGIIANRKLKVGDMASPQVPLCTLMAIDRLKVELRLSETEVTRIQEGQRVIVRLDALPGESFEGRVTRILPYLDPTLHTNTALVTLDNPRDESGKRRLKPGMYARVEIELDRRDRVVVAPQGALLLDDGGDDSLRSAFVVDAAGRARRRIVRLGARDGDHHEVLRGLSEGERLVTRGQHGLSDGQPIAQRTGAHR